MRFNMPIKKLGANLECFFGGKEGDAIQAKCFLKLKVLVEGALEVASHRIAHLANGDLYSLPCKTSSDSGSLSGSIKRIKINSAICITYGFVQNSLTVLDWENVAFLRRYLEVHKHGSKYH